ncbi:MAG: lipid-A-disaccharide synthase N-terminal domain-containing protein [Bacteroidales bacterium]|nr:lipid-A-disaccharide synthase N-terminal domain-containing protein [Bacteroidales bacterium]MBQ9583614.1 lipid-A-disaccharide synthase N-terminal domain-containing protein [Bacteroidales bacterium]
MDSSWLIYAFGFLAQGLFSARMIVQWLISEKQKRVTSPAVYWILSLVASLLFFLYGWLRQDFAIMLGQTISYYIYIWNLKAKGIWQALRPQIGKPLVTMLLALPLAGIVCMAFNDAAVERLLHNEGIPAWLIVFGSAGQIVFTFRFIYQYFYSRARGESLLPAGFWIISLAGSALIVAYGFIRHDWVLCIGQSVGFITYSRNLYLAFRHNEIITGRA